MFEVQILDDYQGQIVHIVVGHRVYHVRLKGDQCEAQCLETQDRVSGHNRQDCLSQMAIILQAKHGSPVQGVTA